MAKQEERRLPEGWQWVKLGDVCEVVMGQSPPGTSYNSNGLGEPLLNGPTEFGLVHPNPVQWTTEPTRFAEQNDILFCVRGATTGRKNIADRRYCIGRGLAAIRGKNNSTDTNFLYILLDHVTHKLLEETAGSTFPNLPGAKLNNFLIPLPPIAEQKRLVAILNDRFAAIETARKATESQLEAAKALPAAYLREVFNSPEAEGWRSVKLGDVCEVRGGKRLPIGSRLVDYKTPFPYIRVTDFQRSSVNLENLKFIEEDIHRQIKQYIIHKDDVYISIAGSIGIIGTIPTTLDGANLTENAAKLVLQDLNIIDKKYLVNFLQSPIGQNQIQKRTNVVGQPKLALTRIKTIEIPLPPIAKQKEIVTTLNDRFATIETIRKAIEDQLEAINALPATLLRQAFNGEL